jgi:uncharacterized protein YdaT
MKKKNGTTHVVPNPKGGWGVKRGGAKRVTKYYENKKDAIARARQISKNNQTELVIQNKDGRIAKKDSHGNDPFPPKG